MEEISQGLGRVRLTPDISDSFSGVFKEITTYAEELRGHLISNAERDVTELLAGPFTCGGLLIILIEPRQHHPWHRGVHGVVRDCNSLYALEEAVHVGSNGMLSLIDDISLLDLRPFIWKSLKDNLGDNQLLKLYDLVIAAIRAKNPDTIICMGDEPREVLRARGFRLPHTRVIYAKHPSYSLNYQKDCFAERRILLESILNACGYTDNQKKLRLFIDRGCAASAQEESSKDATESIINLLRVLVELCLGPRLRLPYLNLESEGFYRLESWHIRYFSHRQKLMDGPNHSREDQIASVLLPIFKSLNRCITPDSVYLHHYKVNWEEVSNVGKDAFPQVIQLYKNHVGDNSEDVMTPFCNERGYGERNQTVIVWDLEAIRLCLVPILQRMQPRFERRCTWIGDLH